MGNGFIGELLGTAVLVLMGNGVVSNVLLTKSKGQNSGWLTIATGWFMAVLLAVLVATAAGSNAHLNPAVTVAMLAAGVFPIENLGAYLGGQFIGAFIGATAVWLTYSAHWAPTDDPGLKLACFSTGPAIRNPIANLITEVIATFIAVLVIVAIFSKGVGSASAPWPLMVAMVFWGVGLSLGGPTGFAVNPARDLGARIAHAVLPIPGKGGSDWAYSWIPVVGPIIGGLLAIAVARGAGFV
jgi:glycerol uptake facilitator protein